MTIQEETRLQRDVQEILSLVRLLTADKKIMKVPAASEYLNLSQPIIRRLCKAGIPGSYVLNAGCKNLHFNIDVIEAGKHIEDWLGKIKR